MASMKYGVWAVWGELGYYGNCKGYMEGITTWDNTYHMKLHMPPIHYMVNIIGCFAPVGGGKAVYLSWSNGVSCKTLSNMCRSWYFANFLLSEGSLMQIYMPSFMFPVTPCDSLSRYHVHGAAMGSPLPPSLPTCLWKSSMSRPLALPHTLPPLAKVCGWYHCPPGGKTQSTITTTHQLTEPTYTGHCRGTKPRSSTFPGHFGFSRSQQHSSRYCLWKGNTLTNIYTGTATTLSQ